MSTYLRYRHCMHFWKTFLKAREDCGGGKMDVPLTLTERRWYIWLCLEFDRLHNGFEHIWNPDRETLCMPNYQMLFKKIVNRSYGFSVCPDWHINISKCVKSLKSVEKVKDFNKMYNKLDKFGKSFCNQINWSYVVAYSVRQHIYGSSFDPHGEFHKKLQERKELDTKMYYMYKAYYSVYVKDDARNRYNALHNALICVNGTNSSDENKKMLGVIYCNLGLFYDPHAKTHDFNSTSEAYSAYKCAIKYGRTECYDQIGYMLEQKGHLQKALKYYILSAKHHNYGYEYTRGIFSVLEKMGLDETLLKKTIENQ